MNIDDPVRVEISNVARWIRGVQLSGEGGVKLSSLAPPFNRAEFSWVENFLKMTGARIVVNYAGGFCGKKREGWECKFGECVFGSSFEYNYGPFVGAVFIHSDINGRWVGTDYGTVFGLDSVEEDVSNSILWPVYFSISLLHCKNVELVDMPISRQMRRQAERKNKQVVQYKTLVIEPLKAQIRNEQHGEKTDIHRALHICRGHFATYTEEKPLFGKLSGTFWKPMHVKGNKKHGEIVKDYKIVAEKDNNRD